MALLFRKILRLLPYVAMLVLLAMMPFTKVEESFNVQLMHDLLYSGGRVVHADAPSSRAPLQEGVAPKWVRAGLKSHDHHSFPGVVPRTTVGAIAVAAAAQPVLRALDLAGSEIPSIAAATNDGTRMIGLYVCRLVLGLVFCWSLSGVADALSHVTTPRRSDRSAAIEGQSLGDAGNWFRVIAALSMYHLMNHASRPFPNTFAAVLVNFAFANVLRGRANRGVAWLAAAAVIFRSDVAVLAAPLIAVLLLSRRLSFLGGLSSGLAAAALALVLTIGVDSILWQRVLWPEGVVFYFNAVQNKSHEWGVFAWHWYFTSALPRGLMLTYPLSVVAIVFGGRYFGVPSILRLTGFAAFAFVGLYSVLPHKELRFVLMSYPMLVAPAAVMVRAVWVRASGVRGFLVKLMIVGALLASVGMVGFLTFANSKVYVGAKSLQLVHDDIRRTWAKTPLEEGQPWRLRVFLDAFACMNGVSRFQKLLATDKVVVTYSKDARVFNRSGYDEHRWPLPRCSDDSPAAFEYLVVRNEDEEWHLRRCSESALPLKKLGEVRMWEPKLQLHEWPYVIGFRKRRFLSVLKIDFGESP